MYLGIRGMVFASFVDCVIGFWNCYASVVVLLRQCGSYATPVW